MKKSKKLPLIAVILVLTAIYAISVSAIQRSNSSDGPLTGQLSDNNASGGGWVAYSDSQTTSNADYIRATVSVTYAFPGQDNVTVNGYRTNYNKSVAGASASTPSGSEFKRESSSHSAKYGTITYSCSNSY